MATREFGSSVAAVLLAATLAVAACGEGSPARSSVEESIAEATGGTDSPSVLATRWLIRPVPEQEPALAAPAGLAVDEERGLVYVLELRPPQLRVYDAGDGKFLRTLGREGDGPGEYRNPIGLALSDRGTSAVLMVSGRVTFWDAESQLIGVVQAGPGLATDIFPARGDTFYVKTELFAPDDVAEFRVVHPDMTAPQTRFNDAAINGLEQPGRSTRNHTYAVGTAAGGGVLIAPPGPGYRILHFSPSGDLRETIVRSDVAPLERSPAEIEAIRERVRKSFAASGRATPRNIPVSLYRSHIARLSVSSDGTIWALTQRGLDGLTLIDRFDKGGRFRDSLFVRLRVSELVATSSQVYMLIRSDLDIPGIAVAERLESGNGS